MRRWLMPFVCWSATACAMATEPATPWVVRAVERAPERVAEVVAPPVLVDELPSASPLEVERHVKVFDGPHGHLDAPAFREPLVAREQTRAIVLMYHSIDLSQALRTVWPWDFEEHIKRLRDNHIEIIALSQLVGFLYGSVPRLPARVAVITIDDGEVLFYKYAWPILQRHAAPFALGIITKPTEFAAHAHALSWAHLNEMLASGLCEIASHGHTHAALTGLKDDEMDFELNHSRDLITAHTGVVPEAFIYPLGAFNERVVSRVENARYRAAFTAVGFPVGAASSPFRINRFKMQRTTSYTALTRFFEREHGSR